MNIPRNHPDLGISSAAIIQYSGGHTRARTPGAGAFTTFVGFHAEQDRHPDFDASCLALGVPEVEIRHNTGEITQHWAFGETFAFFPITAGPIACTIAMSLTSGNAQRTANAGLGIRWERNERSRFAVRGIPMELFIQADYRGLVQISVSSRMGDALIAALCDHTRMAEAADALIDRARHPEEVGLYELALPLGAGTETTWGTVQTVTVVPMISLHPQAITREYLRSVWRPEGVLPLADDQWESIVSWAKDYQERKGDVRQDGD